MRLAIIGVGQAGGKVLDAFLAYDRRTRDEVVAVALAMNTATADLMGLEHVPKENRILFGESRVKGQGVGADNELGARLAIEDIEELQDAVDDVSTHEVDAFLVVAALGGGTGSGAAPVIARRLRKRFVEPVYGLGILPAPAEGSLYTVNAARSFRTFVDEVDNLVLVDNDAWRGATETVKRGYADINEDIVRRLNVIFTAGRVRRPSDVGESVVDARDVINTLACGGVSTLGFASTKLPNPQQSSGSFDWLSRFDRSEQPVDVVEEMNRITGLVRSALGRLLLPCDVSDVERVLLVVAGPPARLNRKGIEASREWLEHETNSRVVRAGDYPLPGSDHVACAILLSGVAQIPRVKELQQAAVEALADIDAKERSSDEKRRALLGDEAEGLDRLF